MAKPVVHVDSVPLGNGMLRNEVWIRSGGKRVTTAVWHSEPGVRITWAPGFDPVTTACLELVQIRSRTLKQKRRVKK